MYLFADIVWNAYAIGGRARRVCHWVSAFLLCARDVYCMIRGVRKRVALRDVRVS